MICLVYGDGEINDRASTHIPPNRHPPHHPSITQFRSSLQHRCQRGDGSRAFPAAHRMENDQNHPKRVHPGPTMIHRRRRVLIEKDSVKEATKKLCCRSRIDQTLCVSVGIESILSSLFISQCHQYISLSKGCETITAHRIVKWAF